MMILTRCVCVCVFTICSCDLLLKLILFWSPNLIPFWFQQNIGALVFASETCALDLVDAKYIREINPGEVVAVDLADMSISSACLMPPKPRKACIFEHMYFALPNSIVFGRAVHESRLAFGKALAEESPVPADVVIPVPDSGFYAALGFSLVSGIPFQQVRALLVVLQLYLAFLLWGLWLQMLCGGLKGNSNHYSNYSGKTYSSSILNHHFDHF